MRSPLLLFLLCQFIASTLSVAVPELRKSTGRQKNASLVSEPDSGIDTGSVSFGPAPAGLFYQNEYGVNHANYAGHPKYFDDTFLLGIPGDPQLFRVLKKFVCTAMKPSMKHGILTGIQSMYALDSDEIWSDYHGWDRLFTFHRVTSYELKAGEKFTQFQLRQCDGKIWGIVVGINGPSGRKWNAVTCGNWAFEQGEKNCEETILAPDDGYHIVGLYGDANGLIFSRRQGLRGLGLITMKD